MKPFLRSSFFLKVILVVSSFILLFIAAISYKHTKALIKTSELIVDSYKFQFQLEQILSMLKDAETGQRGYIITKDTLLLTPYKTAEEKIYKSYLKLKTLTLNDKQNNNLDTLLNLIKLRFELLAYSLKIASAPTINETQLDKNLLHGKIVMEQIRAHINKMDELEIFKLNEHQKTYEKEVTFSPISTLLIMFFALFVFILSYFKMNRDLHKLKKTNEDLLIKNESIEHAEAIGEFGISICDLATNEFHFSDNLFRLLGCEPQSFAATVENYLQYVHPDDRDIVTTGTDKALIENKVYPRQYRIIRKDGEIRYFSSLGKFISEGKRKLHLGIGKDITDQQLYKLALEEKNRELEQSINELESFNRVASHDLQEPLRKIQIFISRISVKDMEFMSDTGKEYLTKITSSANRMRKLIDDLLLFSNTNKTEKVYEKTNLNLLLKDAQQELAQIIEEKKAVIHVSKLPTLTVVSYQILQLFVNILDNALKYSKSSIQPNINIECTVLAINEYPVFITDTHKKYYKISISDNGIGFDQQYSEKIFILFSRLNQRRDYHGSGIGLSICKKIVENHDGFITAEGKIGIGSTFYVFLPV
jgi:PAS domain S-box-containing protein